LTRKLGKERKRKKTRQFVLDGVWWGGKVKGDNRDGEATHRVKKEIGAVVWTEKRVSGR